MKALAPLSCLYLLFTIGTAHLNAQKVSHTSTAGCMAGVVTGGAYQVSDLVMITLENPPVVARDTSPALQAGMTGSRSSPGAGTSSSPGATGDQNHPSDKQFGAAQ